MRPQRASSNQPIHVSDFSEFETPEGLSAVSGGKISVSQLRWALRFREENGLNEAVIKFGRRLYIHKPSFFKWLLNTQK